MEITHSRVQHAVGQGSFHSASIEVRLPDGPRYRYDYVYDCGALRGSTPSPALLKSIHRLDLMPRQDSNGRPVIDALVLSHYDRDHIIGVELLVSLFQVRRVIAPYLTPQELMLVLASQPAALETRHIETLHRLANAAGNGDLFGVPVMQILPGPGDGPAGDTDDGVPPPDVRNADNQPPRDGLYESMVAVEEGSKAALGPALAAGSAMRVAAPQQELFPWRLKFWNRGVSDELLALLFEELVACGFPLHTLDDPNAVAELADWLEFAKNRRAVLMAYAQAISAYQPGWAQEAEGQRLANFLSLAMYSGPAFRAQVAPRYWRPSSGCNVYYSEYWNWRHRRRPWPKVENGRTGWLGTGDAPLGEAGVWADFSAAFRQELGRVLTVQVPHHGAAPKGGPKFFNPALLPDAGMCAVVSAGTTNSYGHPTTQVIKEALAAQAQLEIVTEDSWLGFQEILSFDLP